MFAQGRRFWCVFYSLPIAFYSLKARVSLDHDPNRLPHTYLSILRYWVPRMLNICAPRGSPQTRRYRITSEYDRSFRKARAVDMNKQNYPLVLQVCSNTIFMFVLFIKAMRSDPARGMLHSAWRHSRTI